jgi:hypothetical protein
LVTRASQLAHSRSLSGINASGKLQVLTLLFIGSLSLQTRRLPCTSFPTRTSCTTPYSSTTVWGTSWSSNHTNPSLPAWGARKMIPRQQSPSLARSANESQSNPAFVQITTPNQNATIVAAANGNMYAVPSSLVSSDPVHTSSSLFAKDDSGKLIYSDGAGCVIFGYADTITSMSVSRLRLGSIDALAKTAALL